MNPRKAHTFNGFQDRRNQPLCHPSGFFRCFIRAPASHALCGMPPSAGTSNLQSGGHARRQTTRLGVAGVRPGNRADNATAAFTLMGSGPRIPDAERAAPAPKAQSGAITLQQGNSAAENRTPRSST